MAKYIKLDDVMDALLYEQYGYLCEDAIKAIPAIEIPPHNIDEYETMIVRIRADGVEMNEILEFDGDNLEWCWLNDWFEGQKDIEYIGRIKLSEVKVNETV